MILAWDKHSAFWVGGCASIYRASMIGNLDKTDFDSGHWMLLAKIVNMKNTMILN